MKAFAGQVAVFICLLIAICILAIGMFTKAYAENAEQRKADEDFRKRKASLSGGRANLNWYERTKQKVLYNLDVIKMPHQVFLIMVMGAFLIGFFFGKLILTKTDLSMLMAMLFTLLPFTFISVRSSWYKQHEMAMLESCMVTITSSYRANKDIIKSVHDNINKANMPVAFKNFLSEVTFVDSSVERALRKVGASFDNKYFDEWIEVLIKSQKDSTMMDILPVIVDEMDEAKKAQAESAAAMRGVWREYVVWVITCICVPLILRMNADWYYALVYTPIGKTLVFLLLLFLANTLRSMIRISKMAAGIV